MKKYLVLINMVVTIIMFSGCIKDYTSNTQTKLINTTSYQITIKAYSLGSVDENMKVELQPNETKIVYEDNPWGKTLDPCWGTLLRPYDSVIVVFDNLYSIKHNKFSDTLCLSKCYLESNNRNMTNPDNYNKNVTKEEKKYMTGYFTYTFTEQDYLDAKE